MYGEKWQLGPGLEWGFIRSERYPMLARVLMSQMSQAIHHPQRAGLALSVSEGRSRPHIP